MCRERGETPGTALARVATRAIEAHDRTKADPEHSRRVVLLQELCGSQS